MNLPNKLTLSRIIMVPFFVASLYIPFPHHMAVALGIFMLASVTDFFDGAIARKRGLVTDFGKFLDPLADKILVLCALTCFISFGFTEVYVVLVTLTREFAVSGIRLIASSKGNVIAANIFGKIKTVTQMIAIIFSLVMMYLEELISLNLFPNFSNHSLIFHIISHSLMAIGALFVILSGAVYIIQNRHVIQDM